MKLKAEMQSDFRRGIVIGSPKAYNDVYRISSSAERLPDEKTEISLFYGEKECVEETRLKNMKNKNGLFFGLILVCAAVILVLDGLGYPIGGADLSAWRIIGGVVCLCWLVTEIVKLNFARIFFPLAVIFLLFEGYIAKLLGMEDTDIISNWIVLLAALLLTVGVGAIGGNIKKQKSE